jgi:uncharacterized DUF497 family protein
MTTHHKHNRKRRFFNIGFTNSLAIYIMLFLVIGLIGGFILAWRSIEFGYTGQLLCWTVVFTPIGTACSIVLNSIVRKSEKENLGADGEGVKYATAKARNFETEDMGSEDSPAI